MYVVDRIEDNLVILEDQENKKMDNLINNADKAELYEHLAREHGYAYPDEKIFYDVTPGN